MVTAAGLDETPEKRAPRTPLLDTVSRVSAISIGAIYVFGLLVLNIALHAWNISSGDVSHPRYMLTGSLFIFWIAVAVALIRFIGAVAEQASHWMKQRRWSVLLVSAIMIGLCLWIIAMIIATASAFRLSLQHEWTWIIVGWLLLAGSVLRFFEKQLTDIGRLLRGTVINDGVLPMFVVITTLVIAICTYSYALFVFPRLSAAFGGGHPVRVSLAIALPATTGLRAAGAKIPDDGVTGPVTLLFEDSTSYYIRFDGDPSDRTWRINKASVTGAVYMPSTIVRTL